MDSSIRWNDELSSTVNPANKRHPSAGTSPQRMLGSTLIKMDSSIRWNDELSSTVNPAQERHPSAGWGWDLWTKRSDEGSQEISRLAGNELIKYLAICSL